MKGSLGAIGAFTIALLATTTWSVLRTPLPELPVDTVALADSLLADSLWRDSLTTHEATSPDDTHLAGRGDRPPAQTNVDAQDMNPLTPGPDVAEPGRAMAQTREAYQTLARIIARMKPAEAAEVLVHMSNEEVEGVVRNLGARQAASVLSNLPEQRAAELARRLLNPSPGSDR